MKHVLIESGRVAQVVSTDPAHLFCQEYADLWIQAPEGVEVGWIFDGETLTPPSPAPLAERQVAAWERIKQVRDRRKYLGVKVGEHWFHSDDPSRIQQIALAMMGNAIPAGLMWKTLTTTPPPVFVEMTPALAQGIFTATAASDAAIFAAAEAHRVEMEASPAPEGYDFSASWPVSIEDEA